MARLIVKSPYIKCGGGKSAGGYLKYIATRERVEIIPDDRPPTQNTTCFAVCALVCDFSLKAECVPAFTRESERGPFVREVEKRNEKRFGTALWR